MKVYIVEGVFDHDRGEIIAVFEDEVMAKEMVNRCSEHDKKRPVCSADDSDAAHEKFLAKLERWVKKHPLKARYPHDGYSITALDIIPAATK